MIEKRRENNAAKKRNGGADTTAIKSVVKVEGITLDETTFVNDFRQ